MAGESPDRSKQHESSAEPTSGSAGPVPEARKDKAADPRLAVAREATSPSRGGVDTATRIFSRRELSDAVKNADGETDALDTKAEAADPGDSREAETKNTGDSHEAETKNTGDSREAETKDTGDSETKDTGNSHDAGPEDTGDADDARAEDAGSTRGTKADDAEGTRDAAADDAGDSRDAEADGAEGAEGVEDAPGADGAGTADAEDADGADGAVSEKDAGGAEARSGAAEGSQGPGGAGGAGEAEEAASGASEASDEPDAADAADEPRDDRLRAAVAAWVASADGEEPTAPEKGADARAEAEDDDAPEAADGEDAPQGPPAPDDETRTGGAGGNTKAEGEAEAASDDAPQAADGDDAPQGPPAPDDETRTGGAGGNTKAEGEAEAATDDAPADDAKPPVDQPTAVFKAVRPPKPPVDQPTTTLKAPRPKPTPPAPPAEPPAPERTSKFVALKPDVTTSVPHVGPERTTQQPLPPKPPLDLLAELTNTPPPPDTPVRTAIRRVKIWTPLVLLLVIVFAVVQAVRPLPSPTLDLTAEETYTFEGGKVDIPWPADGQAALDVDGLGTFGSSGTQKPVPIASVAKVMTAYLVLRDHPLKSGDEGPKIKIDQPAEAQATAEGESTVKVTAGDSISQREALEDILIASANNIARLLARWDAGSEKSFVQKMNDAAADLGMKNTTYTDPSGLNNTTVSTAQDQVKLAKAAMKSPAFREVAAMGLYYDYKGEKRFNYNGLVGHHGVVGIKTGTTTSALGNLVFAAKKEVDGETRTVIGAVLRQPAGGSDNTILQGALSAGDQLILAAQDALKSETLLKKGDVVGYVDDGLGGRTPVVATKDVTAIGWAGLKVKLTFAYDDVPHTAKAGTTVGSLTVGDGTSGAVKVPVALEKELTEPGFTDKLTRLG